MRRLANSSILHYCSKMIAVGWHYPELSEWGKWLFR